MIEDVMKLMIVDDEELLTKLLRKIVESSFSGVFAIKTFNDSELAANYIIEENPSIVITDLIMPKIDGQENKFMRIRLYTGSLGYNSVISVLFYILHIFLMFKNLQMMYNFQSFWIRRTISLA